MVATNLTLETPLWTNISTPVSLSSQMLAHNVVS